ncbi:MAG: aromatic-ring-hydroxylating dioxygenase subunit beta [Gammaproteobacteria bacterium]|nr:aromatic-ring-hydroxylating dioxygenase subunit beta [Gammaproteobacteria bacterium]
MSALTREEVENFLYDEAALLDEWKLDEWLGLMTDDVEYFVPPTDEPDSDSSDTLFIVADNAERLKARVYQLTHPGAWAESPPSRTRRMISNVRIRESNGDEHRVTANFIVYRIRNGKTDAYVGRYEHVLVKNGSGIKIRERRSILDHEALRPHGKVSIII